MSGGGAMTVKPSMTLLVAGCPSPTQSSKLCLHFVAIVRFSMPLKSSGGIGRFGAGLGKCCSSSSIPPKH